jgi:hypothetical protein
MHTLAARKTEIRGAAFSMGERVVIIASLDKTAHFGDGNRA